jgi:hypothetical protein
MDITYLDPPSMDTSNFAWREVEKEAFFIEKIQNV